MKINLRGDADDIRKFLADAVADYGEKYPVTWAQFLYKAGKPLGLCTFS